ncbi:MAG: AAA family ATPase [Thermodesulfobacteriota bacterium]|nr:AAA family ATPase [Thermodesulfobacteriota bacterium]
MEKNGYQKQVMAIYRFISDHLYFNRPDIEIKGESYNSTILLSLLTGLTKGKELIIGEPGLGKTTSAEFICSLVYQFPLGVIWGSEVSGHPEQTEEKIIGRPDLGKLNRGEEDVVWTNFSQMPVKIVDEINRLPETKQSMILDGVDRGNWEYLNEMIINDEYCLFATANYQDGGTNTLIAPLVDRFDVIVESRYPGANLSFLIGKSRGKEHILRHPKYEKDLYRVLKSKIAYEKKIPKLEEICNAFGEYVHETLEVKPLRRGDRDRIRTEMGSLDLDLDASAFARMLLAELSFCERYGQKRIVENCEEGCHYTGYLCRQIKNCASNRLPTSIKLFSQGLAWLLGDSEIDIEHVKAVMPFTLSHRVQWKDEVLSQKERAKRDDPFQIFLAKEAVKTVSQRYREQSDHLKDALALGSKIFQGESLEPLEGDHPIYTEIKKDIRHRRNH